MAEAKLSLSLDDLIKKNQPSRAPRSGVRVGGSKVKVQNVKTRSAGGAGGAGSGKPGARGAARASLNQRISSALAVQKPAISKPRRDAPARATGRAAVGRRSEKVAAAASAFLDRDEPDMPGARAPRQLGGRGAAAGSSGRGGAPSGKWQHDLYVPEDGPSRTAPQRQAAQVAGTKLIVSNLDFKVSDADLQELFSVFGKLNKAAIDFDRTGRSLGTAQVVFVSAAHAKAALQKYNGILLDGMRMQIELASEDGIPVKLSSGLRVTFPDGSRASVPAASRGGQVPRIVQQGFRDALTTGGGRGTASGSAAGSGSRVAAAGRGAGMRGRLKSGVVRNTRQTQDDSDMMME